jgi:hypothetical protein
MPRPNSQFHSMLYSLPTILMPKNNLSVRICKATVIY